MNLRTITAKLKAFAAAAKALARGLFFKSQRGVEWHRLTHDRYPWVVAFISLAMVLVMLRIVFFILSPDGKRYAEMASKVNPPRYSAVEPMRGSIYARDGRPVAVTSPSIASSLTSDTKPSSRCVSPSLRRMATASSRPSASRSSSSAPSMRQAWTRWPS